MGTPLRKIIYDIGGGVPGGRAFKAVQPGGPSGGCIPKELIDSSVDFEKLKELGSMMGSGGMIVMDEDTCMVDVARYFLYFRDEESCGKCVPCRLGVKRMHEMVARICKGEGQPGDIEKLQDLAETIQEAALCGLGKSSPNPVLSTLRYFRHEFEAHIFDKECPAGVCRRLAGAPCQKGCPAGIDVPSYVTLIADGHYEQALEVVRADNPFPSVCGRICNHGCEVTCTRGEVDSPIAIMQLKRFISDFEVTHEFHPPSPAPRDKTQQVAVVGGGPAGLTAAYFLAQKGYPVTIFEASAELGGMLAQAIPEFRLPKNPLQRDIAYILSQGIEARTKTMVGKDVSIEELREQGYGAVFMAIGAHRGLEMGVFGENLYEGVVEALEYLKASNLGQPVHGAKKVVVIGGGYAAVDAARVAVRRGAEVHLVYRRDEKDLPADPLELQAAREEGVQFHFLSTPTKILAANNRVNGVECIGLETAGRDTSGRQRVLPKEGTEYVLAADLIISAVGLKPDLSAFFGASFVAVSPWQTLLVDPETLQTSVPYIFAGGDLITGMASVIEAVAIGKRAAWAIDNYLSGQTTKYPAARPRLRLDKLEIPAEEASATHRPEMAFLPLAERQKGFQEAELGLSEDQAVREARRCLRCDLTE
jgi:NADH-quinone oxidoreductase subunit F